MKKKYKTHTIPANREVEWFSYVTIFFPPQHESRDRRAEPISERAHFVVVGCCRKQFLLVLLGSSCGRNSQSLRQRLRQRTDTLTQRSRSFFFSGFSRSRSPGWLQLWPPPLKWVSCFVDSILPLCGGSFAYFFEVSGQLEKMWIFFSNWKCF